MNEMMVQTMNFGVPMIYMWLLMILAIALYFMPTIVAVSTSQQSVLDRRPKCSLWLDDAGLAAATGLGLFWRSVLYLVAPR